jgi:hypothetical protein
MTAEHGGTAATEFSDRERRRPPRTRIGDMMDDETQAYVDGIAAEHRPLFDRLNRLILEAHPDAAVRISYRIPTYTAGGRRLYVGLSLYGWQHGHDAGFASRHPALLSGRATIRLRPEDAAAISDDELRDLARAALDA